MNTQEYSAIALARWVTVRLDTSNDFACEGLPQLDIVTLFRELAEDPRFELVAGDFSIVLAGFDVTCTDMELAARQSGLTGIRAYADDLHVAAGWRNERDGHPRTLALAAGYNAGVHTLGHYARPRAVDLALTLLEDSRDRLAIRFPGSPDIHRQLLLDLSREPDLRSLLSLEGCADFLARWDSLRPEHGNSAPRLALSALGLLQDRDLFGKDKLGARLKLNLDITQKVRTLRASTVRALAKRRYRDLERGRAVSAAVVAVEAYLLAIQDGSEVALELEDALLVVRPPKNPGKQAPQDDEADEPSTAPVDESEPTADAPQPDLVQAAGDALLDGNEEDLAAIANALDEAWAIAEQEGGDRLSLDVTLPSIGQHIETIHTIDTKVLDWVEAFCAESRWGGWFETRETDLYQALAGAADHSPRFINPDAIVTIDGEDLSLTSILAAWDEDIPDLSHGTITSLAQTWREFRRLRDKLLPHLGKLIFHARHWLDGRPKILADVRQYLDMAAKLYRETQDCYQVMASSSPDWARAALESLLALDIIQVSVLRADGKRLAKAILLPTHPLQLWRNERLSSLLRGLANSSEMATDERETVRKELERPEQFLTVVRLPSLPAGHGLGQVLPYTNQIEGLPVYENLSNACSGADGVRGLKEALDQFVIHNPNRPFPLRLSVVNPPVGDELVLKLVDLLKAPRYRGGQRLSALHLDLYASGQHADRLRNSLRFKKTPQEDAVQEKVAAGRLAVQIHDQGLAPGTSLESVVQQLRERPSHVVALFDESTIQLRQRTVGRALPMSPFCVRYDVHLDRRSGRIELRPQPGESPFNEFLELMNEMEGHQRDGAVQTYADAEGLAEIADSLLQGPRPAATWLFLADRALPSEAGMQSVRIWERREGLRDTFLAARNFASLARLLRSSKAFSRCIVKIDSQAMERLLHQGARLLGVGLLSLVKKHDGVADEKQVIGFAGLLFAARDFQRSLPGALVLSVDHPLAQLWLRTGNPRSASRCDLLVLWKNPMDGGFELTAVEVKTSDADVLKNNSTRLPQAVEQIGHTLEAIDDGLAAIGDTPPSPLSVPRCEMLKQTLARAAQARCGEPDLDRANRRLWGGWLQELFGVTDGTPPMVRLQGSVVSVLLRRASRGGTERLPANGHWSISHRILGEPELDDLLLEPEAISNSAGDPPAPKPAPDSGSPSQRPIANATEQKPDMAKARTKSAPIGPQSDAPDDVMLRSLSNPPSTKTSAPVEQQDNGVSADTDNPGLSWPPDVNALGMIGQDDAVSRLVEQAVFARSTGERFSDKLLVGPAGVGKSTLARKIGDMLNYGDPLFFNGSDLRKPADLVQRLIDTEVVTEVESGETAVVQPALLFIDEVHGISSSVATVLLSAMDDSRVTTVDGRLYDFNQVIFLLATTDPGRLTEAFQSRPNKTWLRPYTLHEMAGIVWLHGKSSLDGEELSQDACYEIAARNRCNPRRSVRELSETLRPHFFSKVMASKEGQPSMADVADLLVQDNIAQFYDTQGIDSNGLDGIALRFLRYLRQQGAASEPTLRQALGLAHPQDFIETAEYLLRLGLIETSSAGRRLTRQGERYLKSDSPPDLRNRISRAG